MYPEILKTDQARLLPLIKAFKSGFYLVGGTAIALHIGHRYSLDFDLFSNEEIHVGRIKSKLRRLGYSIQHILYEDRSQLNCVIDSVKLTFYHFPYHIEASSCFDGWINMPDLLTLGAMKVFALGGIGKWKDYVDLYHIFKDHHSLSEVCERAKSVFGNAFNEKLFRQQLAYYDDISFEEEVEYLGEKIERKDVKSFLTELALKSMRGE